jgi:hypothetical protein
MRRNIGLWALLALPMLFGFSTESRALVCGADVCEVAGNVNGSPLVVGDFGNFATSVDAVNDTLVGKPPENSGDSYAHAWQFALNERAHIAGTLTKNNTLPNFAQDPVSIQLFSQADLANAIGGTFFVPSNSQPNPFAAFRFANLEPGVYFFKVAGTLIGNDGQYAGQLTVGEVPLPPAIWLFLTAILGLTTIVRKRRTVAAA